MTTLSMLAFSYSVSVSTPISASASSNSSDSSRSLMLLNTVISGIFSERIRYPAIIGNAKELAFYGEVEYGLDDEGVRNIRPGFDGAEGKRAREIFVHDSGRMIGGRSHDLCSRPLLPLNESLLRYAFDAVEFFSRCASRTRQW